LMETLYNNFNLDGVVINMLDGIRISLESGWGLIRVSNTTPNLMLRFEADNNDSLQYIQALFRAEISRILPHLTLPF
jgi:phosphomannomutase/phosphoglucomutase